MRLMNLGLVFSMFLTLFNPASLDINPTHAKTNEIVYSINNGSVDTLGSIPGWNVDADEFGIEVNKISKGVGLKVKSDSGFSALTSLSTMQTTLNVSVEWTVVGNEQSTLTIASKNNDKVVDSKTGTGLSGVLNQTKVSLTGTDANALELSASGNVDIHIKSVTVENVTLENGTFTKNMAVPGWVHSGETISGTTIDGNNFITLTDSVASTVLTKTEKITLLNENLSDFIIEYDLDVIKQSHSVEIAVRFYNEKGTSVGFYNTLLKGLAGKGLTTHTLTATAVTGAKSFEVIVSSGGVSNTELLIESVSVKQVVSEAPAKAIHETLYNPGFEIKDGTDIGWNLVSTGGKIAIANDIKLNGDSSLYFEDSVIEGVLDLSAPRVMSDKFKIDGGEDIIVTTNVYAVQQTHNIVLEVYFYDAAGTLIQQKQELFSSNSLGVAKWSKMNLQTKVPATATSMAIAFYSGQPSLTKAYFDDVSVTVLPKEVPLDRPYLKSELIGPMVDVSLGQAAAIGYNPNGELEVYFHSNGLPGTFSVLDGITGELKFSAVAPGTEAVWGMVIGKDGTVYFASTGDGTLFAYDPIAQTMESVGVNPTDQWTWDLELAEDGKIYGSTYPNAGVWEYDPATGEFRDYGAMVDDADYVRGIAVEGDYVYAATGTTRHLIQLNRHTGEKSEIVIEGHTGTNGFFEDLRIIGDKMLVSSGSVNNLVIDRNTLEVLDSFHYNNNISLPDPNDSDVIYFKSNQQLYKYNLKTLEKTLIELDVLLPDTARVKDFMWVGDELAFITAYGEYMFYNPAEQSLRFVNLDISAQPVAIQVLEAGFDGKIYMGGYQRGMSIYNPFTGKKEVNLSSFAQPEGIGFLNGKVYYGTYVAAIMYALDPTLPIELGNNPEMIHAIGDHQDRPFAITSGDDKLFVGTVPDYGVLGGVLAIYEEKTDTWFQERNVVEDQSIISLEYHDGYLYGGTSIWGGLDANQTQTEAKLFIWDTKTNTKVKEMTLDIPGIDEAPKMIGDLSVGPDGLLWGIVDGTVFAMDMDTHEIVKSKMIQPSKYNSSKWLPYRIQWGPDGMMYTTTSRQLTVIDPVTLQYKVLESEFVNNMTVNIDGTIFYSLGTDLYQIRVPETNATIASIKLDGQAIENYSPGTLSYQVNVDAIEKVDVELSVAAGTYTVENDKDNKVITITVVASDKKSTLVYTVVYGEVTVENTSDLDIEVELNLTGYESMIKSMKVAVAEYFENVKETVLSNLASMLEALDLEIEKYVTFSLTPLDENGEKVQLKDGHTQEFIVAIPEGFKSDGALYVYHINNDGTLTLLESEVREGKLYFTATEFSDFMLVQAQPLEQDPGTPGTPGTPEDPATPETPNENGNNNGGSLPSTGMEAPSLKPLYLVALGLVVLKLRKKETA